MGWPHRLWEGARGGRAQAPAAWSQKGHPREGGQRQVWHQQMPRAGVAAAAGPQGAPPPRPEPGGTRVPEVPLTSDAMLGGSSSSGSLDPPGLEDKTRLTTSSAPGRGPQGGAARGSRTALGGAAARGAADASSARVLGVPAPARPAPRPAATHSPPPGRAVWPPPASPRGFSGGDGVSSRRDLSRLLAAVAPIPEGPMWAGRPPARPGAGRPQGVGWGRCLLLGAPGSKSSGRWGQELGVEAETRAGPGGRYI